MDNNSATNNSADIIEYARQAVEKINDEYRGAAPGEFDTEIAVNMLNTVEILMSTAVRLESISVLSEMANGIVNMEDPDVLGQKLIETLRDVILNS